jgi:thymidylate synthase
MTQRSYSNFAQAINETERDMVEMGLPVHTERWQGMEIQHRPDMKMYELLNHGFQVRELKTLDLEYYKEQIKPNLPWADDHFLERVGGEPINPGEEWKNWPWGKHASKSLVDGQKFNHNYMERYWPKYAGKTHDGHLSQDNHLLENYGIRNNYGDLSDLIQLIVKEPLTRQAWLPIFFPEDTGISDGGRKPCTLGYQFIIRDNKLHIYYPLRSCDLMRHFRDDIYLTIRLGIFILDECRKYKPEVFNDISLGSYTMHCTSLHIFEGDLAKLKKTHNGDTKTANTSKYNFEAML